MAGWAWRPQPTWRLTRAGTAGTVDITGRVLDWEVMHGCDWSPADGRWSLQSAVGHVRLDNRDRALDTSRPAALIAAADTLTPLPVTLTLGPTGATLWQGVAVVRGSRRIRGDDTVVWELRGRWWQLVRRRWTWLQPPGDVAAGELARRVLRDAAGAAAAADLRSPLSRWPDSVELRDVALDAPGGIAWTQLAQCLGGRPIEDSIGRLGVVAADRAVAGTAYPRGQAVLDDSVIETVGTAQLWATDVVHRTWTDTAPAVLVRSAAAGGTRQHTARYEWPAGAASVGWTGAAPTTPAGWTVVDWWALPDPTTPRSDIVRAVLRQDTPSAQPSGVQWTGTVRTAGGDRIVTVAPPPAAVTAQRTVTAIPTPPWVVPGGSTSAHERHVGWAAEPKIRAELVVPLWARTDAGQLDIDPQSAARQLAVGHVSRWGIDGSGADAGELDMITALVRLRGSTSTVPTAHITGWTDSTARGRTSGLDLGAGWPLPFDLPAPPAPTATSRLRAVALVGSWAPAQWWRTETWWLPDPQRRWSVRLPLIVRLPLGPWSTDVAVRWRVTSTALPDRWTLSRTLASDRPAASTRPHRTRLDGVATSGLSPQLARPIAPGVQLVDTVTAATTGTTPTDPPPSASYQRAAQAELAGVQLTLELLPIAAADVPAGHQAVWPDPEHSSGTLTIPAPAS